MSKKALSNAEFEELFGAGDTEEVEQRSDRKRDDAGDDSGCEGNKDDASHKKFMSERNLSTEEREQQTYRSYVTDEKRDRLS